MSYRAQNLHAEIFLVVIRWLYRPKVPKVSKNHDFDDFLKGQNGGKNGDNPTGDDPTGDNPKLIKNQFRRL